MPAAPLHPHEEARISALHRLEVLDTAAEDAYQELVDLAARIAGTPIALVSLVDRERQWFKARHGIDSQETPRSSAFCAHAILTPQQPLVVDDASTDSRFADNPLVTGAPNIRFYAGIPLLSPAGDLPLGTLCVISSEVMKLTEAQMDALRILAHQVERLFALRQYAADLRQKNQRLEEATLAKSRFLTTLSHDIRTPMNGIIGNTELLASFRLPARAAEHLATIRACSNSLLHLINNILDLSKIESGALELTDEDFNLHDLTREVAAVIFDKATNKGLDLNVVVQSSVPVWVRGDPGRLHQIMLNLVSNAVKFTQRGRVDLHLDVSPPQRLVITVTDSGVGMSAEDQRRIFQPFVQVGNDTATKREGSGLGLSIVRHLAEAMEGTLTVNSALGVGSQFQVSLPLRVATAVHQPVGPADFSSVDLTKMRVLLVDDDPVNRAVAGAMLNRLGIRARLLSSGRAALDLNPADFDFVFMDCQMPELDGIETTRLWRAREPAGRRVPIVALTADAFEENRRNCLAAGMDELLTKPITLGSLRKCLQFFRRPQPAIG